MSSELTPTPLPSAQEGDEGIDLLRLLVVLISEWRLFCAISVIFFLLFAAYIFKMPSQYISSVQILPTSHSGQNDTFASFLVGAAALVPFT